MTKPMPDTDPLKREPPGSPSKIPGDIDESGGRTPPKPDERGIDVPAEPGRPSPAPTNPDLPGGPPEPVNPGKKPSL